MNIHRYKVRNTYPDPFIKRRIFSFTEKKVEGDCSFRVCKTFKWDVIPIEANEIKERKFETFITKSLYNGIRKEEFMFKLVGEIFVHLDGKFFKVVLEHACKIEIYWKVSIPLEKK